MIALSFDIEEFDLPLEHGIRFPFERQIAVSTRGAERILDVLDKHGIKATFFSTLNFANHGRGGLYSQKKEKFINS